MKKIYVTRPIDDSGIKLLRKFFEVDIQSEFRDLTPSEFRRNIKGYDGVLAMLTNPIDAETFREAPSVKVFANYAVGYNNINLEEATRFGVAITNTPNALTFATAELAFTLLLSLNRKIIESSQALKRGEFIGWDPLAFLGYSLKNKKMGIVGAGRIGQAFAKMSRGFDMELFYNSPKRKYDFEKETKAIYLDLENLLKTCDIIALHCPYNKDTHHLINASNLPLMKANSVLINTSRGGVIDEGALYKHLKEKRIYGAALDVFENEPEVFPGLMDLDNVLLTPHIGSGTFESRRDMSILAAESIIDILINNKIPPNCLNKNYADKL